MRILLCTDGSPDAAQAVRFSLRLARRAVDTIRLLGVVEDHADVKQSFHAALDTLGSELHTSGVAYEMKLRYGHAAEQILDEADSWPADLIVIGRLGRRGLTRFRMGGTATRVVQYAKCSVLLVKEQHLTLQKILVCTAGGEPGLRDVSMAGQVAVAAQAEVTVLHVMSQVALTEKGYQPDLDALAADLIARHTREGVHLETAQRTLQDLGLKTAVKVRHGLVIDEIVSETKEGHYDLLVAGAHLARGLSRWLLDDVTTQVLEEVGVPVLVVRGVTPPGSQL